MKRFFRFLFRLLIFAVVVAALILSGVLFSQLQTLTTQIDALTTRVHRLEQAGQARPGSQAPQPTATPTSHPTATAIATPTPAPSRTPTSKPTATGTPGSQAGAPASTPTHTPTAADTGSQAAATPASTPAATAANTSTPAATATSPPAPTSTATRPPTATNTPVPTATNTPAPTSTATSPPTATPAPTATNTPVPTSTATPADPYFIVSSARVNVRTGPGNNFPIIGTVVQGERFDIIARNRGNNLNATWIEFCCVNEQRGWIYAPLLNLSVDWSAVPVSNNIPVPPTATPVPPTNTPVPRPTASQGGGGLEGITIGPENRCSHYDSDDYSYPQSVEPRIVAQQGNRIYGPYTGTYFASIRETDIEHIVARSEAHDSGLCRADGNTRRAFGRDLLNLTLASPSVNRHQKVDKDLAQWLPALNQCWYVNQVVLVKRKYNLTMDQAEAAVARHVLAGCSSTAMQFTDAGSAPQPPPATATPVPPPAGSGSNCDSDPLGCWDDNNNGRITCAEARRHGIAPVPRGHPAYQYMRDGDGDGVVCE